MTSRTGSTILSTTVHFTKSTYTNRFAEVDVSSDCSCACVEPVGVIGGEFFERGSFDDIDPGGNFDFTYVKLARLFKCTSRSSSSSKGCKLRYLIVSRIEHML
jgi:hypothetical protein